MTEMNKFFRLLAIILLILAVVPNEAFAATGTVPTEYVFYNEDGSSLTIKLMVADVEPMALMPKTGTKFAVYKDANGNEEWRAVLTGTFAYDGTYSTCSASNWKVTITNDAWYVISKQTGKSGNTATGELVMGRKFAGVKVDEETVKLSITCDQHGNIS